MEGRRLEYKIDKESAIKKLTKGNFFRKKKADRVELKWIDFYLFEVEVNPKVSDSKSDWVIIEMHTGAFSFFKNIDLPFTPFEGEANGSISVEEAKAIARREYSFHLLHRNLLTKLNAEISSVTFREIIQYPFWIGYFIHPNHYSIEIIDAISGKPQAGKLKSAIIELLLHEFENAAARGSMQKKLQDIVHSSDR